MLASSAIASPSPISFAASRATARFSVDLESEAEVEPELRLAALQRPHAAAHARDEPLPRELGEVAANGDLGNRKLLRKFRNLNGIARLEHLQHLLHPLALRQTREVLRVTRAF